MDIKKIEPELKKYLNKVKRKIPIKNVILFGSYAKGKATKNSDVDLIILSEKFKNMTEDDRLKILYRLSVGFPYDLHAYGLTPQEFEKASPLTSLFEAKKTGKRIPKHFY